MKAASLTLLITLLLPCHALPQRSYFADGYHGGIYGHYPLWKTQFIVDKLAENPWWTINLEIEPSTWDTVALRTPAAYEAFRRVALTPRVEFTNPSYSQPYLYNISGESVIRNFQYGMATLRRHFPGVTFTAYSAEEPCFTSCLPGLLLSLGFRYAVLKNPDTCWGGYVRARGGELVEWQGPDGATILTVPRYGCEELEPGSVWQTRAWNNSREYLNTCRKAGIAAPAGMCFQDAGWKNGPWLGQRRDIQYVSWTNYIENISAGRTTDVYRYTQDDFRVALMWGSEALRRIGQQVRRAEDALVRAEKVAAMACMEEGSAWPGGVFEEAWRKLMLAQHHDTWIVPYNKLYGDTWAGWAGRWTSEAAAAADSIAAASMRGAGAEKAGIPVTIVNTSGSKRSETVCVAVPNDVTGDDFAVYDPDGNRAESCITSDGVVRKLLIAASAPAFGYAVYRVVPEGRAGTSAAARGVTVGRHGKYIVETDLYRMVIDPRRGGSIESLEAKKLGNKQFAANKDYRFGELSGYFRQGGRQSSCDAPARVTVLRDDALGVCLRIDGSITSHPFTQTVTLARGERAIRFSLKISWRGNPAIGEQPAGEKWAQGRTGFYDSRYKLNVLFPTLPGADIVYRDAPFDVCRSDNGDTFFNAWKDIKNNVALHWVDIAQRDGGYGLAIFTDHTTSYTHGQDFPLGLTIQYSGGGLWWRDYGITGPAEMSYAVMPHAGLWDGGGVSLENERISEPATALWGVAGRRDRHSFVNFLKPGYTISSAVIDGGDLVLRIYNAWGDASPVAMELDCGAKAMREERLDGPAVGAVALEKTGDVARATLSMPRHAVKTYRISIK